MDKSKLDTSAIEYNRGFDAGLDAATWKLEAKNARISNQSKALQRLEGSRSAIRSYNAHLKKLLFFSMEYLPKDSALYRDVQKLFRNGGEE